MKYDNFTNWYGGDDIPNPGGYVKVQLRNGYITQGWVNDFDWEHRDRNHYPSETDIVGYEVIQ